MIVLFNVLFWQENWPIFVYIHKADLMEAIGRKVPGLNRLLLRTFLGNIIMIGLIQFYETFADPDPVTAGTFVFFGMVMVMCLGVQWLLYQLKIRFLLISYPALISNILGLALFYTFLFMKQPFLLFGVVLLVLSILGWHLVRYSYK